MSRKCLLFFSLLIVCFTFLRGSGSVAGEDPYSHLSRAIELYNESRYDESFDELTLQIGQDRFCALAYYYRAGIRVKKGEYHQAAVSLKAAFRDSTGFTDAVGLHAYILKKQGKTDEALNEWKRFTEIAGKIDEEITVESIVHPETYHEERERIQREKIGEKLKQQEAHADSQKLRKADAPASMPVVDFIEQKRDGAVKEDEKPAIKTPGFGHFLSQIKYLLIIGAAIVLFLYLLKFKRYKRRPRKQKEIITGVPNEHISFPRPADDQSVIISDGTRKKSDTVSGDIYERAMRLKEEREQHAREIKRLLEEL